MARMILCVSLLSKFFKNLRQFDNAVLYKKAVNNVAVKFYQLNKSDGIWYEIEIYFPHTEKINKINYTYRNLGDENLYPKTIVEIDEVLVER